MFFKPSPASNVSSPSNTTSKERDFIVDSAASLHVLSKSGFTPEESETVPKSKDQAGILTTNGTVICTCLFKFNYWNNHPRYSRWVKL